MVQNYYHVDVPEWLQEPSLLVFFGITYHSPLAFWELGTTRILLLKSAGYTGEYLCYRVVVSHSLRFRV